MRAWHPPIDTDTTHRQRQTNSQTHKDTDTHRQKQTNKHRSRHTDTDTHTQLFQLLKKFPYEGLIVILLYNKSFNTRKRLIKRFHYSIWNSIWIEMWKLTGDFRYLTYWKPWYENRRNGFINSSEISILYIILKHIRLVITDLSNWMFSGNVSIRDLMNFESNQKIEDISLSNKVNSFEVSIWSIFAP